MSKLIIVPKDKEAEFALDYDLARAKTLVTYLKISLINSLKLY